MLTLDAPSRRPENRRPTMTQRSSRQPHGIRALLVIALLAGALLARPVTANAEQLACQGHDTFSQVLVERARQRVAQMSGGNSGVSLQNITTTGELGLSTTGPARFVVIRVSFPAAEDGSEPAMTIPTSQTNEDLAALFNGTNGSGTAAPAYPHESLNAYYERASYGKFDPQAAVVVDYTAQHNRSYYEGNARELFYEALSGIDDEVDFSTCDANGDGKIDGIYLQYGGPTGDWGTTWWPAMYSLDDDSHTFDGKTARGAVLLKSDAETNDEFCATLIHETGHVLGLPDLYHYSNSMLGLRSFDLMYNNTGDVDGFLKWMLDWIDDDKIIYAYVSEQGVDIRRGSGAIEHHDGAVEETLAAWSEDGDATATGGFIAVSDDASILDGNLLCNFYLVQYAHRAGNDTVSSWDEELGHGFRIYRVQAAYNDGYFNRSNSTGSAHEQLIEALLPSDDGETAWELGALYHADMAATPASTPSTNYGESLVRGYSGISLEVVEDGANAGRIRISWAARAAQDPLTMTYQGSATGSSNSEAYVFDLSREVAANWWIEDAGHAKIVADGTEHDATWELDESGTKLTVYTRLAATAVQPGAKMQVKIESGAFVLAFDAQGMPSETSEELTASVPSSDVAVVDSVGTYDNATVPVGDIRRLSEVFEIGGESYFFAYNYSYESYDDSLALYRLVGDGRSCERVEIAGLSDLLKGDATSIEVQTQEDDRIFVRLLHEDEDGRSAARDVLLDISAGQVLVSRVEDAEECAGTSELIPISGGVARTRKLDNSSWELWSYRFDGSKLVVARSTWDDGAAMYVERFVDAGEGYVAALRPDNGDVGVVALWNVEDIVDASSFSSVPAARLEVPRNFHLGGVRVANGLVYVAALDNLGDEGGDRFANELLVYDLAGNLVKRAEVPRLPEDFSLIVDVRISRKGAVSLSFRRSDTSTRLEPSRLNVLLDSSLRQVGTLTSYEGQCIGAWTDERWLSLDWGLLEGDVPEQLPVHWTLTTRVGGAEPSKPENSGTSENPDDSSSSPETSADGKLPATGDFVGSPLLVAMALATCTLGIIIRVAHTKHS